jgi:nucleoside-diphosphate-sugar epimerase
MRTLVTGASGFLGRYVVRELHRREQAVSAMVRASSVVPVELAELCVEVLRCDLRRPGPELARELERCDAVVHLAAGTSGSARSRFDATVLATERLIDTMDEVGWRGRLVHVSTLAVYAFNQVPAGGVIDESTPPEPHLDRRDDYAWVKSVQEQLVGELRDQGAVEVVVVRPGAVYGHERQFQHRLGRRLGAGGVLLIGGRNPMPLNYVENTAALLGECTVNPRAAGQTFNAIDPQPPRQYQYLRRWRHAQSSPVRVIPLPLTVYHTIAAAYELGERLSGGRISSPGLLARYPMMANLRSYRYDTGRAAAVLGWRPPVSRAQAFARTFAATPPQPAARDCSGAGVDARPAQPANGTPSVSHAVSGAGAIAPEHNGHPDAGERERVADRMRMLVVVPFLNEERYLGELLQSVGEQTRPPDRLLLVDDGSEDGSPTIAAEFAARHPYARVLRRPPRKVGRDRLAHGVALAAFEWALQRAEEPWDVAAKVDADLRLPPSMLATLERELIVDPRLGIVGTYLVERGPDGVPVRHRCPEDHVNGATKFYRRECHEQISPIPALLGWDTIDEIRARLHGWITRSVDLPEGDPLHLRPMGTHDGLLRGYRRWGSCAYTYGEHPLHILAVAVQRLSDRPPVLGSLNYVLGWMMAGLRRMPRAEPELREHVARDTRRRVLRRLRLGGAVTAAPVAQPEEGST